MRIEQLIIENIDKFHWISKNWDSIPNGTNPLHLVLAHSTIHRIDYWSDTIKQFSEERWR
jgi:hypothetical protein